MYQAVPFENTGMLFAPSPLTIVLNVVVFASVTKALEPAPALAALGNKATVVGIVLTVLATTLLPDETLPTTVKLFPCILATSLLL